MHISENHSNFEVDRTAVLVKNVVSNIFEKQKNKNLTSFNIDYGELVCIIGETGSGKSTLLKQLAGVIDIQGQIIFKPCLQGGKKGPILSYVPQSPAIINDSVKNNIIFLRDSLNDAETLNEVLSVVKLNKRVLSAINGVENSSERIWKQSIWWREV